MKAFVTAPKRAEVKKLAPVAEDESVISDFLESIRKGACNFVVSMGVSLGCTSESQTDFLSKMCQGVNAVGSAMGCEIVEPEPEPECVDDNDCGENKTCVENVCVAEDLECETEDDCDPWENCSDNECVPDPEHCRQTGCPDHQSCDDPSGECEWNEGYCGTSEDCTEDPEKPYCKVDENVCVECTEPMDCEDNEECVSNECVACDGAGSYCETSEECCSWLYCRTDINECTETP